MTGGANAYDKRGGAMARINGAARVARAIVARTYTTRRISPVPGDTVTTVKYQACTQNRIVLGTSREHMLEFA